MAEAEAGVGEQGRGAGVGVANSALDHVKDLIQ